MDFATAMTKNRGNKLPPGNAIRPRGIPPSHGIGDDAFSSDGQRNLSQKGRPLPAESSWRLNGVEAARGNFNGYGSAKGSSPCPVNDNVVPPGGELAGKNRGPRKSTARDIVDVGNKESHGKRSDSFIERAFSGKLHLRDTVAPTDRSARDSFSIPSCLPQGLAKRQTNQRNVIEGSILRRSSAFLASLTHSASRFAERRPNENLSRQGKSSANVRSTETACPTNYPSSRGYYSILNSVTNEFGLRRSPSVCTLPAECRRKSVVRVKKSVSFSSDTSFEEKRALYRRPAVHEVKIYRKGVLQDCSAREPVIVAKVPTTSEEASEGLSALLTAAKDADDATLGEIAAQVRKFGFGIMDVNMADGSGRTAISYMAGNGALAMLELTLSAEGVNPNVPDNEGNTPLHFAAQAGQTECLNVLLQRCPDIEIDARNASGFTPLMKAALQGRTKCAKILLFAGANPTLRDHGRGLRAEQWARFCGRYVCAEVIERFARHRLLERSTSCRWGSEPELAAKVFQGKVMPLPTMPLSSPCSGLKSKIRKVFRTTSGPDRNFSLVSQLTSAALCASSPALPKSSEVPPVVKSLLRPLSVPQLRVTLVPPQDFLDRSKEKYGSNFAEKIENTVGKPARSKKKTK